MPTAFADEDALRKELAARYSTLTAYCDQYEHTSISSVRTSSETFDRCAAADGRRRQIWSANNGITADRKNWSDEQFHYYYSDAEGFRKWDRISVKAENWSLFSYLEYSSPWGRLTPHPNERGATPFTLSPSQPDLELTSYVRDQTTIGLSKKDGLVRYVEKTDKFGGKEIFKISNVRTDDAVTATDFVVTIPLKDRILNSQSLSTRVGFGAILAFCIGVIVGASTIVSLGAERGVRKIETWFRAASSIAPGLLVAGIGTFIGTAFLFPYVWMYLIAPSAMIVAFVPSISVGILICYFVGRRISSRLGIKP